MGANESTRKITVINEDTAGAIRISEAALRRAQNTVASQIVGENQQNAPRDQSQSQLQLFAAPMETLTLRKNHEEQLSRMQESWNKQKNVYEKQNRELWKSTTTRLAHDLTEIEAKYMTRRRYDLICPDKERLVEECYQKNANKALQCSQQVREFVSCVDGAKRTALVSKGLN